VKRWTRFVPLAPVLLAPLVVVAIALSPSRPPSMASGHDVISFYVANPSPRLLSAYLGGVVVFLDLFIYGWLRDYLRRDSATAWLANIAFGSAVLFAAGSGVSFGCQYALADVPGRLDPAAAQALNVLQNDVFLFIEGPGIAGLMVSAGMAIASSGLLPAWLGWIGILFGLIALTPFAFPICIIALGVWTLVVGLLAFLRADRSSALATPSP
jgi:hypothetical protein